jgi:hypothetical protein
MTGSDPTTRLVFSSAPPAGDELVVAVTEVPGVAPPPPGDELLHATASDATAAQMTVGRATRITLIIIDAILGGDREVISMPITIRS